MNPRVPARQKTASPSLHRLTVTYSGARSRKRTQACPVFCTHCGSEVPRAFLSAARSDEPTFCCLGCRTVYGLLTAGGLGQYYELRKQADDLTAVKPVTVSSETYRYLDDPEFRKRHASRGASEMDFYLEGVHCAACLWLVEKLPVLMPGIVEHATLDIGRSVARVKLTANGAFAPVARRLEELGYKPHPIEFNEKAELLQRRENRRWLIRVGVAGACSGNVMLMAIPLYSGLDGELANSFRWLSLALFLPVLLYCAVPFYRSAAASIRSRTMSIDLPIVLAILLGTVASISHLISGSEHIYFDSLSALVFLLLASRFVLRRIQQNAFHYSHLMQFLSPTFAKRIDESSGAPVEVAVHTLKAGERIEVGPCEVIPADGVIRGGAGMVNCALLTGESQPQVVGLGDVVFSGTVNESAALQIEVTSTGEQTRLGQILRQIEEGAQKKANIVTAADQAAKWFLVIVLTAAATTLLFAPSLSEGVSRALALVIVTCPCALALATPLAMSVALGRAARAGILVKGADVLEKISKAKNIALDKTGTLTMGDFEVLELSGSEELKKSIYCLESKSRHPIARALVAFLSSRVSQVLPAISEFKETVGVGVEGTVEGHHVALRSIREAHGTTVGIYRDNSLVGTARLGDRVRDESGRCVAALRRNGLQPFIVSGDNQGSVEEVAEQVGIPTSQTLSCADPESKQRFIQSHERSIMVGDGANDALALSVAYVGVAVHGSMEVSLRAADVYLTRPGLTPVVSLVQLGHETMRTIYRNFSFSLLYNIVGGIAAASGHVTPLVAAVLMPLSALTVFGSSLLGTRVRL